eukprot:759061-Hanusia_phi.AAC.1
MTEYDRYLAVNGVPSVLHFGKQGHCCRISADKALMIFLTRSAFGFATSSRAELLIRRRYDFNALTISTSFETRLTRLTFEAHSTIPSCVFRR